MSTLSIDSDNGARSKQRVVVIAPGRGCYNKEELGYLARFHPDKQCLVATIDAYRAARGQVGIAALDAEVKYSFKLHTPGANASALIYACAMADFIDIDTAQFEIVAVTGNSMGWYIALALAGALAPEAAIEVINTMGSMMSEGLIGGQLIYPEIDQQWRPDASKTALLDKVLVAVNRHEGCELFTSIFLGGYRVLAGNEAGLKFAEEQLPQLDDRYPMRLYNHGAFHSPLLHGVSEKGFAQLPLSLFQTPKIPLVDGRGQIWTQYSTDTAKLREYTLGEQVVEPYDFSKAVTVAIKEFAPDKLVVLGPGNTLVGPVAQSLIAMNAFGWQTKADFSATQGRQPKLIAMGNQLQRSLTRAPCDVTQS